MRTTIERKIYDTDDAEEIAEWRNGLPVSDFSHVEETLYRTPKGAYFLHGEGGPMSPYSRAVGNTSHGDSVIQPMTRDDAFDWCEKRDLQDVIDAHFADMVEEA